MAPVRRTVRPHTSTVTKVSQGKRRTRASRTAPAPKPGPVETRGVEWLVWAEALKLAAGDTSRIRIVSRREVVVTNG